MAKTHNHKLRTILTARWHAPLTPYEAGRDCARHGANTTNCHFALFSSPERTAEWERGKRDGDATVRTVQHG